MLVCIRYASFVHIAGTKQIRIGWRITLTLNLVHKHLAIVCAGHETVQPVIWRYSDVKWGQITGNSGVWEQSLHANNRENTTTPHYWSFVRGIHRWTQSQHRVANTVIGCMALSAHYSREDINACYWFTRSLLDIRTKAGRHSYHSRGIL